MISTVISLLTLTGVLLLSPTPAMAADCPGVTSNSAQDQVLDGADVAGSGCSTEGVERTIRTVTDILSIVIGAAAVIVILLSGFKYITSAGDSGKITSAKQTLIYAVVGLVIAALAQVIVNFVLQETNVATKPFCTSSQNPATGNCVAKPSCTGLQTPTTTNCVERRPACTGSKKPESDNCHKS